MRIREKIASVLALLFFAVIYTFFCWPMVCAVRFAGWLTREKESFIRPQVAWCAHWWGNLTLSVARAVLRIKVVVTLEGDRNLLYERPCIVISNHQSTLDVAVMTLVMKVIDKLNSRWILKEELRDGSFVVGWIAQRTGCAFVSRRGDPKDTQEVVRCARVLREDDAAVVFFPEGTRFSAEKKTDAYNHLLPPKTRGFNMFREELSDPPVASVTLHWNPSITTGKKGRTLFQAGDFYGKTLHVDIRIASSEEIRADPNWLVTEWERKERALAEYHRVHS